MDFIKIALVPITLTVGLTYLNVKRNAYTKKGVQRARRRREEEENRSPLSDKPLGR